MFSCTELGVRCNEFVYPLACAVNEIVGEDTTIDCDSHLGSKWGKRRYITGVLPMFLVVMIIWRIDAVPPPSDLVEKNELKRRDGEPFVIVVVNPIWIE